MFSRPLLPLFLLLTLALTGVAQALSPTAGDLAGVVRDMRNNPIANVRVRIAGGPSEGSVRTDRTGAYKIPDLLPGDYDLFFQKPGYNTAHKGLVKISVNQATTLNMRLEWADATTGAVEVRAEEFRGGAALPETTLDLLQNGNLVSRTTADEYGTTVFPGVTPGFYTLAARRPGFLDAALRQFRVRPGQMVPVTIRLNRNLNEVGRLGGFVRNALGTPIAGAKVKIVSGYSTGELTTNGSGRYEFPNLIPGSNYALEVTAAGFQVQSAAGLTVNLLQLTTQDFTLVPNAPTKGSLTGRVTNAEGQGLAFAQVEITAGPALGMEVITGADGRYVFSDLVPGNYSVLAQLAGYSPAGRSGVDVQAGRSRVVDLELLNRTVPAGSIGGTVREAGSGLLLPDVVVELVGGPSGGLSTTTDLSGGFVIQNIIPGEDYTLRFRKDNYLPTSRFQIDVSPGQRTTVDASLTLQLVTIGNIEGSVKPYGANSGLTGVRVTLFQGPTSPLTMTTGADGKFVFRNLRPGEGYGLRLEKKGYATLTRTGISLSAGQVFRTGELVMNRATQVGNLRVVVQNLGSQPVSGASIYVIEGPSRPPRGETNASGIAMLEALLPGTYTIDAVANGYQTQRKTFINVTGGRTNQVNFQLLR